MNLFLLVWGFLWIFKASADHVISVAPGENTAITAAHVWQYRQNLNDDYNAADDQIRGLVGARSFIYFYKTNNIDQNRIENHLNSIRGMLQDLKEEEIIDEPKYNLYIEEPNHLTADNSEESTQFRSGVTGAAVHRLRDYGSVAYSGSSR